MFLPALEEDTNSFLHDMFRFCISVALKIALMMGRS
jgi:hypothetical protein